LVAQSQIAKDKLNVLLIDIDSTMPNLALMKLSAYHKQKGDSVIFSHVRKSTLGLVTHNYEIDKVYISCIFTWNDKLAMKLARHFAQLGKPVALGGPGHIALVPIGLPAGAEHVKPDYSIYGIDYSMGFLSRGCSRGCPFCRVSQLEGSIHQHSWFDEFLHPNHEKVVLLDNNILMSERWEEALTFLVEKNLKVSICQGFDARLIDEKAAKLIAKVKCYDWRFKYPAYYTAWDSIQDEKIVLSGIQNLIDAGVKARNIRPYVLVGFGTSLENDLYRFKKLRQLGTYPYVMPFNNRKHPLKRWGQRPALYKSVPFEEYDPKIEPH